MSDRDYTELYASLQKETTILTAQIRALYRELDKKFHLRGAQIPITFGFETDALGSPGFYIKKRTCTAFFI